MEVAAGLTDRAELFNLPPEPFVYSLYFLILQLAGSSMPAAQQGSDIIGTWRVDAGTDTKNGPREVIIRADSSASWGKEVVRWRLKGDRISIVLGGEWETHKIRVKADAMTLSGGDLKTPVTLKRVGPATPRAPGVRIPADPDAGE